VSDALLTDTPRTEEEPPTDDQKIQKDADRYVRMAGGDPKDPASAQRALAKALSDNNRLAALSKERQQQDAVISELRARVGALEHTRDDFVPPPAEVDPDDADQLNIVVDRLLTKNPEAQSIFARWQEQRDEASKIAERDRNGAVIGGELFTVQNDVAMLRSNLDDANRARLGLPPLADIDKEDLENKLEKASAKADRLIATYREYARAMRELQAENNDLRERTRERVREKAKLARQQAAERAAAPKREAEAEALWDDSFATVSGGLPPETAELLEHHLLLLADSVVNGMGEQIPDLNSWIQKQSDKFLKSTGIAQGRGDVEAARLKERDYRQPAPLGRASLAVPERSEKITSGDRLRAADRRSALLSRRISAR
jgi:DNA repair exonuclease SbcCD ATPase subunit